MRCFYPLQAWQSSGGEVHFYPKGTEGKSSSRRADYARELVLPCGQCIGCRVERSRSWATRCMHEASMHDENSFLTLTYDDDHVPMQGQLVYSHFQKFMKRLRKRVGEVRFYMCGEYGEQFDRPHFHCILFGHGFYGDRVPFRQSPTGTLYRSPLLESLWTAGLSSVGEVTFESAAYVARYCIKKVNGKLADDHYTCVDGPTGEIYQKEPEFARMSLKPGIGAGWIDKYPDDVVNAGGVMVNDMKVGVPRYYLDMLSKREDLKRDLLDATRSRNIVSVAPNDNSYERMRVKEEVFKAKLSSKKRLLL